MNHKVAGKKRFARGQDEFNSSVHLAHRNFIWLQKDNFSIPRNRDRISGCFMSLQRFTERLAGRPRRSGRHTAQKCSGYRFLTFDLVPYSLIKDSQPFSRSNAGASVDFPAPFGPAMTTTLGI
jgi:hypothetical protein